MNRSHLSFGPSAGAGLAALVLLGIGFFFLLPSASASAAEAHPFVASFGSFSSPSGVAVDESSAQTQGNVLVADGGENNTLDIFGPEGGAPAGVASPYEIGGFAFGGEPSGVAVDNSAASASEGDVYVADVQDNAVKKFARDPTGEKYELIGELTPGAGEPALHEPLGVAVDARGDVYVADFGSEAVVEFSPAGLEISRIELGSLFGSASSLAFDSRGDLFVQGYNAGAVYKFAANGSGEIEAGTTPSEVLAEGATGIAVDPTTDTLYVALGNHVATYEALDETEPPTPEAEFGLGNIASSARIAIDFATGDIYVTDPGKGEVDLFGSPILPAVTTGAATDLTETSATLTGSVDPEGVELTECLFEYGPTEAYGEVAPCAESPAEIGSGTSPQPVHADLQGLNPATGYRFRLHAANLGGGADGGDRSFITVGPPTIAGASVSRVGQGSATLEAEINPDGLPTTFRFQYVDDAHFQEGGFSDPATVTTPAGAPLEGDFSLHDVRQSISGLQAATVYHFRVIAANTASAVPILGSGETFSTLNAAELPDNRGFELVSPADKGAVGYAGVAGLGNGLPFAVAESGESVAYEIQNGLPGTTAGGEVVYQATRMPSGWQSTQITPPNLINNLNPSTNAVAGTFAYFSSDLSCEIVQTAQPLTPDTPAADIAAGVTNLYRRNPDGSFTLLTAGVPSNTEFSAAGFDFIADGASSDCAHVVFESGYEYPGSGYEGPPLTRPKQILYEWSPPDTVRNVGVLPDSTSVAAEAGGESGIGKTRWNSISADGSRIFFLADEDGPSGHESALFAREDGSVTVDLSESQTATPDVGAVYQGASRDGARVFFTANYGLTSTSSNGPTTSDCADEELSVSSCDLYEFDLGTHELSDLSADANPADRLGAEVGGVLGFSDDGTYVYFDAQGQLLPGRGNTFAQNQSGGGSYNVYLSHAGHLSFVGLTTAGDQLSRSGAGGALIGSDQSWASQVTPDGLHLLFVSSADITGYQSGGVAEAYLYSAASGTTTCVSCRRDGRPSVGRPSLDENPTRPLPVIGATVGSLSPLNVPRAVSVDGSRVFFTMPDVLAPGATEGARNLYEWENGTVYFLATPTGRASKVDFEGASADGEDVFLLTKEPLVPQDTDSKTDLYDLRVDGGFPSPASPPIPCDALAEGSCQRGSSPEPAVSGPASANFVGPANAKPRRCKNGLVRRRGNCVRKAKRRRHGHKKHGKSRGRRTKQRHSPARHLAHRGHHRPGSAR